MLGNKPPYTTMQQLNLDWILSKLKTLLRLVPDDGAVGQILRRTRDGAVWSDEQGGGGGAVQSVNGQTGAVVLDAADVGALPDDYTPPVTSVNGQTGAVTVSVPVQSVNGQTGAVVLDAADVGALPDDYTPPVLWTNTTPTSDFDGQDILLDLANYSAVFIVAKHATSAGRDISSFCFVGDDGMLFSSETSGTSPYVQVKLRYYSVYNNKITFGAGRHGYPTGYSGSDNAVMIPYKIYGIK